MGHITTNLLPCYLCLVLLVMSLALQNGVASAFVVQPFSASRHPTGSLPPNALSKAPSPLLWQPTTTTSTTTEPSNSNTALFSSMGPMATRGIELAHVLYDSTSTAFEAWEWTNAIGAPAALVAGAVLVTLSESRQETTPRKKDSRTLRALKLSMRFLLLTSFALEVVSIFVSTMTGSVLLGHGPQTVAKKMIGYASPLQLLYHHHELEYLTTQICFLQGLFNWLAAVAIDMVLPKDNETKSAKRMNKCLAGWLASMILWMLAFYNHHLSFYSDYFTMLRRFATLFVKCYVLETPIRPLSLLYIPSFLYSLRLTVKAFLSPPELDEE